MCNLANAILEYLTWVLVCGLNINITSTKYVVIAHIPLIDRGALGALINQYQLVHYNTSIDIDKS